MTTDHELLARIDEYCYSSNHTSILIGVVTESRTVNYKPSLCVSCKSLRAVVEREEKPIADNRADELLESARGDGNIDDAFERGLEIGEMYGYNQCLADIKADIKKELG